jgi:superfamily II DNA or RNA helicase
MKSYIAKRGYVIYKSSISLETLENLKKELMVQPYVNQEFSEPIKPFPVFLENKEKIYIPKEFGIKKFGKPSEDKLPEANSITLNFNGSLRPHQEEPISKCLSAFENIGGGILSLPCGEGKTACACYLISQMKQKTLVLVHKEFLMNQWIERIGQFLPGSKIGKIQGKTIDIDDKDIVIGMIQSISMKSYEMNTFDSFGFVILDEAHRCPSREFSKSLQKINCKYMLGLSATPDRKDGLTKILKWFIGDIIFMRKGKSMLNSLVERYIYDCDEEAYNKELMGYYGKINSAGMINQISEYMPRTEFICKKMKECLLEKRQILLLADRKEMLKDIEKIMIKGGASVGYYIGGMKRAKLDESATKEVILATFQMAQEGLDISTIDTIILATPKTEIEQAVGRIRPKVNPGEDVNPPLVIDMVDNFSMFEKQALKRYQFYKKKNYFIETFKVNMDGTKQEKMSTFDPNDDTGRKRSKNTPDKKAPKLTGFGFANENL